MRRNIGKTFGMMCLAAGLLSAPAWPQQQPITPEDFYKIRNVGDPQLSPDGSQIAYTVTKADQKQNKKHSEIWLVSADGSHDPRELTNNPQASSSPRWSPDGKAIAFLSARPSADEDAKNAPKRQVMVLSLDGGEPRPLTNIKTGVNSFVWSPDGTKLVCESKIGPSDASAGNAADRSDTKHYVHPTFKFDGQGYFDDRRGHLWIVDVKSGHSKQITEGDDWNDAGAVWSPDSTHIAFNSDRTGDFYENISHSVPAIWVMSAEGGEPVKITGEYGSGGSIAWSPDGKTIAFLGSKPGFHEPPRLMLVPSSGGQANEVAHDLDLTAKGLEWVDDGRALYFTSDVKANAHLFRVDASSGNISQVTHGERYVGNVNLNEHSGLMTYTATDFEHPGDVYVARMDGSQEKQLTHVNEAFLKKVGVQPLERMSYKAEDGWSVDGFLVKPVGWQEGKKYPMLLWIHGGPEGAFGTSWSLPVQVWAAQGWAVFFTNPRASDGYGTKFMEGARLEWGGKIYTDIMSGVDAVTKRDSWINQDKMGVLGCSFGGYMTNWIIGHTNRFKAAIPMCSISDLVSDEGTRDDYYGHAGDFGGDLYQNFDLYWKYSPVHWAANVKTPTLFLHGEADQRVPMEQPEQMFRALHHFHVPAEIVFFPKESHGGLFNGEPHHIVEAMHWQIYWFEKYLDGNTAALPPDAIKKDNKHNAEAQGSSD